MTEAEKALILAFVDNSIAQLQALRGAVGILCRQKVSIHKEEAPDTPRVPDDAFGRAWERAFSGITKGGDDLTGEEKGPNAQ